MKPDLAHCSLEGDYSTEKPRLRVAKGGRLVQLNFARSQALEWNAEQFGSNFGGIRAKCRGFSFSSRRRMMNKLNTVKVDAPLPAFVTLTFPDSCFNDSVPLFAQESKGVLDTWLKRLRRVVPHANGFWRLEWQARKSGAFEGKLFPHFHLMIWGLESRPVPGRSDDRLEHFVPVRDKQLQFDLLHLMDNYIEASASKREKILAESDKMWVVGTQLSDGRQVECCVKEAYTRRHTWQEITCHNTDGSHPGSVFEPACMSFQDWVSMSWYHVVDSHDINHFSAGARVERVRTWGGVMSYASKYMAKADAEFLGEIPFGRSWGIFNREQIPWAELVEMELAQDVGVRLRRVARRYLEHKLGRKWKAPYGLTVFFDGAQFLRLIPPPPPPW
jgi:hypothetical protein